MLPKLSVVLSLLLASFVQASPTPHNQRALGGVLICNDPNAQGHCEYAVYKPDTCYNLPPKLINNAATFAPDDAAFFCNPYLMKCGVVCKSPEGCTLGPVSFDYPHKFNLTAVGWNNYITSFDCHRNQTGQTTSQTTSQASQTSQTSQTTQIIQTTQTIQTTQMTQTSQTSSWEELNPTTLPYGYYWY